jgi:hypothetical protein
MLHEEGIHGATRTVSVSNTCRSCLYTTNRVDENRLEQNDTSIPIESMKGDMYLLMHGCTTYIYLFIYLFI